MTVPPGWGLYVHVPWCRIRCPYCPFVVVPDGGTAARDSEAFVDRILSWTDHPAFPGAPRTVYLGGGTPSRLALPALTRLLRALTAHAPEEVTVEANPEDVTPAWLDAALDAGMTRLSLGVQTMNGAHARRLGRAHTPADARRALALVADAGLTSWSVDVMVGLPEQTLAEVDEDLDALLAHAPPHVSLYGLTIEPGTPFERAVARGQLVPPDNDAQAVLLDRVVARLRAAGIHRYEVSNAARPGHEAVHNRGYWQGRPYLGLGPGAHSSTPEGARFQHVDDLDAWWSVPDPETGHEDPSPERTAIDRLLGGLRAIEGIDLAALARDTGLSPAASCVQTLVDGGLLDREGSRVVPTERGLALADAVTARMVDALSLVEATGPRR